MLGTVAGAADPKNPLSKTEIGKLLAAGKNDEVFGIIIRTVQATGQAPAGFDDYKSVKAAWEKQKATTNKHY